MTNEQLYLAVGLPTLMALVAIAVNIVLYLYLAGRVDRQGERFHDDMQSIMGRDREMDKRVMKLESK